jgi:hypothetical protein
LQQVIKENEEKSYKSICSSEEYEKTKDMAQTQYEQKEKQVHYIMFIIFV